jgi:predicted Zn-dependent protease
MIKRYSRVVLVGLEMLGLLFWTVSCAVNPVTGSHEFMLLSEADEINLGKETDGQVVQEYGIYKDPEMTAYLDGMCQRLGKVSHRPNLSYQLKVLDASVVNAFAVPGGYVYFTRGILASLNNEAELAGVMAHEVGHITARHSAQQYSNAQLAQVTLGVGSAVASAVGLSSLSGLAQLGASMLFLRFSRDNERQADSLGVEYSSKLNYDASQMAEFFQTLEQMNPGSDRSGLPGWFSTHPSPVDRVKDVRAQAQQWQQKLALTHPVVNGDTYLRKIDGLIFGDDPRQGYVKDNIFYHPDLRFQFPVPDRWTLQNTPSQVQMVNEEKDAAILFGISAGTSSGEVAKKFVTQTKAQVISSGSIGVNGLPSHRVLSNVQTEKGTIRVISYFIEMDKKIFVFHGLTSPQKFQNVQALFERTMGQFKGLSDPNRINVKPDRLRIRTTQTADTLENSLRSFGVPNDQMEQMALLNGRQLNDRVAANTLIKVVEKGR